MQQKLQIEEEMEEHDVFLDEGEYICNFIPA